MFDAPVATLPNHRERQIMQQLRDRGWVKAIEIVGGAVTLRRLIEKRWIESKGHGRDLTYRITEQGIAAKKSLIPIKRQSRSGAENERSAELESSVPQWRP